MRPAPWSRDAAIATVSDSIWRYVTASARSEEIPLQAAALLKMPVGHVRTLAAIHFMRSEPVERLLRELPTLLRRLTTTTVSEEEASAERVRGAINWTGTFSAQAVSGLPNMYVTRPARRAFQTPENELLVHVLDAIVRVGQRTGWHRSAQEELGRAIRDSVSAATRWSSARPLTEVQRRTPTPARIARIRSGRSRRRYRAALDAYRLLRRYIDVVDVGAVREAVEDHALITAGDDTLLELLCAFSFEPALAATGWDVELPGLLRGGGRLLRGRRNGVVLDIYYQQTPSVVSQGSRYGAVQGAHDFAGIGAMRPDLVIRRSAHGEVRWILVEVKGGSRPAVDQYARDAIQNLLAYRRAFDAGLAGSPEPYGLGIAWGRELKPSNAAEITLCTPDTIVDALELLVNDE